MKRLTAQEQLEIIQPVLRDWMIHLEIRAALGPIPGEPSVEPDPEVKRWIEWIDEQRIKENKDARRD